MRIKVYLKMNERIMGPLEHDHVASLFQKGRIAEDALVSEDKKNWIPVAAVTQDWFGTVGTARVGEVRYCPNCGLPAYYEGQELCTSCGAKLPPPQTGASEQSILIPQSYEIASSTPQDVSQVQGMQPVQSMPPASMASEMRGERQSSSPGEKNMTVGRAILTVIKFVIAAFGLWVVIAFFNWSSIWKLSFTGIQKVFSRVVGKTMVDTVELAKMIKKSIQEKYDKDKVNVTVKDLTLVHENGNKYSGIATLWEHENDMTSSASVEVVVDGENLVWKIIPLGK